MWKRGGSCWSRWPRSRPDLVEPRRTGNSIERECSVAARQLDRTLGGSVVLIAVERSSYNPTLPRAGQERPPSMKFRSIAVEGPIGVGKTSFVELLARKLRRVQGPRRARQPLPRPGFYKDQAGRRVPGAAVLSALALPPAAGAVPARPVPPDHAVRLHLPQGQDLRLPQPRRQRAADLRQALRHARGPGAQAGSGHLPAGRDAKPWSNASGGATATTRRASPRPTSTRSTRPTTTSSSTTRRPRCWSSTPPKIDFVHEEEHLDELVEQIRKMDRGVQYYRPLGSSA